MKFSIDTTSRIPVFQQIVDQLHFAINTRELAAGTKLPSIRRLAADSGVAVNTVAKALRQLEFRGLIESRERSGFVVAGVAGKGGSRYQARGVSADKAEVHNVVDRMDPGAMPGAFCKMTEDFLSGDPQKCNVIHADGSGTKSILAYLHYKETGDPGVFRGIAQDSIVMNLDDLICVGTNGRIIISNTINRNALNCPGEVVSALIDGSEQYLAQLRDQGVNIYSGGGETADVGDLTGTLVVDSCAVAIMRKADVIRNRITPDLAIVGLSSTGQARGEAMENSGIGSNGLTSARHDMLSAYYGEKYPETFDPNISRDLVYCGPWRMEDALPDTPLTVGQALLSPTRSFAPVIQRTLSVLGPELIGIVHCSGGGQTKCLRFGTGIHYIKDQLFDTPPLFVAIQHASNTDWQEMYKVFNMGHRMEVFVPHARVGEVIAIAAEFGISARRIGHTEATKRNRLSLTDPGGREFIYH